ncbi:MAG: (Fe-S)-binding protein [Desulfobacterales bacterium]|jgi:Fe-S oxidoreductase
MFDFREEMNRFIEKCTACGECVTVCPIIPMTDIKTDDSADVMQAVVDLYRAGNVSDMARTRIYSCMRCQTCQPACPEDLDPGLGITMARGVLGEKGEPLPRGLSFLLPEADFNFMKAIEAVQIIPAERAWITNVEKQQPAPARTVVFTGCTGILQPDLVLTALDLIRRFDPTVQALGGVDYCCGDTNLRAGNHQIATNNFVNLVDGLNAFSPQTVVFLCPTCSDFFDLHQPETNWNWRFVTDFLADHLDDLGSFAPIETTVTIHDACHLVRGDKPGSESPRKLLNAIPGIQIVEMKHNRERALCCGGSAMAAIGKPGVDFRTQRLQQAEQTGAQIMALYCTGCQSVFSPERPNWPFQIEAILKLLGRSLGIVHKDHLMRYLNYQDGQKVLREIEARLAEAELPVEKLKRFVPKYFAGPTVKKR